MSNIVLEELNQHLSRDYLMALTGCVVSIFTFRVTSYWIHHTRMLACLNNDSQRYFKIANPEWAKFKNHILYAPLFRWRHNREWQLSKARNVGTLPTRFQALFLLAILTSNITLCVYGLPWNESHSQVLPLLRNRTGTLSVANLIPVMLLSSPKNPFIFLLNVPYDSMNIMHRNFARLAIVEAIVHMTCHVISAVQSSGWSAFKISITHNSVITTGTVTIIALIILSIQSISTIRHAFYETFVHLHIALIIAALAFLWLHLDGLPQLYCLVGAIVIWASMRLLRLATFLSHNIGRGGTKATVEVLPGDAMRISITNPRVIMPRPGSYMYLNIPSVGLWTSHPFSIVWNDLELPLSSTNSGPTYEEKGGVSTKHEEVDPDPKPRQMLSAVVRRRTGFTETLFQQASAGPSSPLVLRAFVEPTYGLSQSSLFSCGTVMLIAGGVGITHQIPYVRHLVEGYAAGTVAARKVMLVWITQSPEHLEWIRPFMTQILAMEMRRDVLLVKVFVTRPGKDGREVTSPSATVQMFPARPDVGKLIGKQCNTQTGCMGVSVCGPAGLSDDVRRAVRTELGRGRNIEFVEQAFTW